MLRKIDCIMIRVPDITAAVEYYIAVLGLRHNWTREHAVGLGFPETDAEIVLHDFDDMPGPAEAHYLVDDVVGAVAELTRQGCHILVAPFEIEIGQCAVIEDPFGVRLCILDMTKGPLV